jgi:CBS domain-containing protein
MGQARDIPALFLPISCRDVMFDRLVKEIMDTDRARQLGPEVSVTSAARVMAHGKFGAVLVVENGTLKGIFTERDALFRVIAAGRDPEATAIAQVMTPDPQAVGPDDTFGFALVVMQEGGFRHAPVVMEGKPVGVLSSRNAMDPEMEEFVAEARRRLHLAKGR